MEILRTLERHYGDMQDTEFTVQDERLYMLQTRNAKRPAQAAVRFAVDAVGGGPARSRARRSRRSTRRRSTRCCTRRSTRAPTTRWSRRGVAASPGAAKGEIVLSAAEAVRGGSGGPRGDPRALVHRGRRRRRLSRRARHPHERGRQGEPCGACRARHGPPGGHRRERRARSTSGRGRGPRRRARAARRRSRSRSTAASAGSRWRTCRWSSRRSPSSFRRCSSGATSCARWACRANADTPADVDKAIELGAEGVGLCRTEHMFLGERQPLMAAVIMAEDDAERTARDRAAAPAAGGRLRADPARPSTAGR